MLLAKLRPWLTIPALILFLFAVHVMFFPSAFQHNIKVLLKSYNDYNTKAESSGKSQEEIISATTATESAQPSAVANVAKKMLVVASVRGQNISWTDGLDWERTIMHPEPPLRNKGREANLFLSYIIQNYNNLSDITAFTHHHMKAWHVDAPGKSMIEILTHLRLSYVEQEGYASFRCGNIPGNCDDFMRPLKKNQRNGKEVAGAYQALFNQSVPETLASPCCAQFAVTRDQIRQRPLGDYQHFHKWLMETELPDALSGRIFEWTWHIIFGKDHIHCVNTRACWCNMYGWCDKGIWY